VPLTIVLINALDANPQTRSIAILLGPEVKEKLKSEEETRSAGRVVE
jgi:hypothetical protein